MTAKKMFSLLVSMVLFASFASSSNPAFAQNLNLNCGNNWITDRTYIKIQSISGLGTLLSSTTSHEVTIEYEQVGQDIPTFELEVFAVNKAYYKIGPITPSSAGGNRKSVTFSITDPNSFIPPNDPNGENTEYTLSLYGERGQGHYLCSVGSYYVQYDTEKPPEVTCYVTPGTVNACGTAGGCQDPQEVCTTYGCRKINNSCGYTTLSCGQTGDPATQGCNCNDASETLQPIPGGSWCCGWVQGTQCLATKPVVEPSCGTVRTLMNREVCEIRNSNGDIVQYNLSSESTKCVARATTCCKLASSCPLPQNVCGLLETSANGTTTCKVGSENFSLEGSGLLACTGDRFCCSDQTACTAIIADNEGTGGGNIENSETGSLLDAIKGPTNETFNALNPLNIAAGRPGESARSPYFAALQTPGGIISRVLLFAFPIAGMILFIMIVWGGFEMVTGATNAKSMDAGKQRITAAIIGFVLLFVSYWLMQIIEVVFGLAIL